MTHTGFSGGDQIRPAADEQRFLLTESKRPTTAGPLLRCSMRHFLMVSSQL